MLEALFIIGIYQSVLEEIVLSQASSPGEFHYLQPYSSSRIQALSQSPPTIQNPVRLYASTTDHPDIISYTGQIIDWADKTTMPRERWDYVYNEIRLRQPGEGGLYVSGYDDIERPSVNLLTISELVRLSAPFPTTELIKVSDGRPYGSGRTTSGGWSPVYLHETHRYRNLSLNIPTAEQEAVDSGAFDIESLEDERKRRATSIVQRRGQPDFRRKLIDAYGGRCAITGFDALDALEACHIIGYKGPETNHIQNGLLLRADIHTLFDLKLVGIEPDTGTILIGERLRGTEYAELEGKQALLPKDPGLRPSTDALRTHWEEARRNGR